MNKHEAMSLYVNSKLCASPWNKVFNKSFWINGGFEWPTLDQLYTPLQGSEDFAILPYAICKSDRTIISDYDFYNYNLNDSSKSATCSIEEIKACLYSGYSLTDKFINDEVFLKMNNFNIHGLVFSHFRYVFNLNKQSMSEAYMQLFLATINDYIQKYSVKIKKNNFKAIKRFYTDYTTASRENNYFLGYPLSASLYESSKKNSDSIFKKWLNKSKKRENTLTKIFSKKTSLHIVKIQKICGYILLITGVLIVTGKIQSLGFYLLEWLPFLGRLG